jgi:hypothetical protein
LDFILTDESVRHPRCIVWQTRAGSYSDFEFQYIDKVLLANVAHENIFDALRYGQKVPGSVVIISHDRSHVPPEAITYIEQSKPGALIHLSGEHLRPAHLLYKSVPAVLRSYFDPRIAGGNVFAVPLGFKSGHLQEAKSPASVPRDIIWSFAGQLRGDRAAMLQSLAPLKPHFTHVTAGWNTPDWLPPEALTDRLRRSIFGPCPFGLINPDSFRIMECLESGAIPVALKFRGFDYFRYVYGDHPFVIAGSWRDAARQMSALLENRQKLALKQDAVAAWYASFKQALAADAAQILSSNFDGLRSEQFKYQLAGRRNLRLKLMFDLHFGTSPRFRKLRRSLARWSLWA